MYDRSNLTSYHDRQTLQIFEQRYEDFFDKKHDFFCEIGIKTQLHLDQSLNIYHRLSTDTDELSRIKPLYLLGILTCHDYY